MTAIDNKPPRLDIEIPLHQPATEEEQKTYRFEAIAGPLNEVRSSCEMTGDESLICMIDAAYRICRACCCAWVFYRTKNVFDLWP